MFKIQAGSMVGILMLALFGLPALAGQNVGNGGAVVTGTCDGHDNTLPVTQLLDFWELQRGYGLKPELGNPGDTVDTHIEVAFSRLQRVDLPRADLYRQWYRDFWQEAVSQDERIPLPVLRDLGNINPPLPSGCATAKIIEQVAPVSEFFVKRYYVRQSAFDALDPINQAGLILHEIIYRDALVRGHGTSMKARVVTGLLSTTWFAQLTPDRYEGFMVEQGLIGYMGGTFYGAGIKRFFDHRPVSLSGATGFCDQLKGDSRMADDNDFNFSPSSSATGLGNLYRASAIGHRILGNDNSGMVEFFLGDGAVIADNAGSRPGTAMRTDALPFLCLQEVEQSPWTSQ